LNRHFDIDKARAVILCGISGSGKTVFSQTLESKGYVRVSSDEIIWDEYGDAFASLSFEEQRPVFAATSRKVLDETIRLLADGKKVVVDSTMCKRIKRDEIVAACRAVGVDPSIVYLRSSYQILHDRLATRRGTGPNDQIVPDKQLQGFYNNFEAPGDDENAIIIDQE